MLKKYIFYMYKNVFNFAKNIKKTTFFNEIR